MYGRVTMGDGAYGSRGGVADVWGMARRQVWRVSDVLADFSVRRPAAAVGIALGMGALVGWLVKRR